MRSPSSSTLTISLPRPSHIEQALYIKLFVIDVLGRAGWVINLDKGQMPTQATTYLGFVVDSRSMRIYLPEAKVEKILEKILNLRKSSWVHVREVASVVGNIQAGARALGEQAVRVCTRALYRDVDRAPTWEWKLRLSSEALHELKFWAENLVSLNSYPLRKTQVPVLVNFLFAGDAFGVGGFLGNFGSNKTLLSLPFSKEQMEQSSTWRELFVLHAFYTSRQAEALWGKTILHLCDCVCQFVK